MELDELYERDFYAWVLKNAHFLRQEDLESRKKIDRLGIAVTLDQLAMNEKQLLVTRLSDLILSLIRWQVQGLMRSGSFKLHVSIQRDEVQEVLDDSPSLMDRIDEILHHSYRRAHLAARAITGLTADHFSEVCPYTLDQIMDETFFPEEAPGETG
jgi:hypothetical protein